MAHDDSINPKTFRAAVNTLVYIYGPKVYASALHQDIVWPEEFIAMIEKITVAQGYDTQEYQILCCPSQILDSQRRVHSFASAIRNRKQIPIEVVDMYSFLTDSPTDKKLYSHWVRIILEKLDHKNSDLSQSLDKYASYRELVSCDPVTWPGELINKAFTFCGALGVFEGPLMRTWCEKRGGTDLAEYCANYFVHWVQLEAEENALSVLPIIYCVLKFWKGEDLGNQGNQEVVWKVHNIRALYEGSFNGLRQLVIRKHGAEICRQKCDMYNPQTI